jgi:rod shape-determining protein MreC
MIILGRADTQFAERVRTTVTDGFAPVLDALSRPAATVRDMVEDVHQLAALRTENDRLREENERLRGWQQIARDQEAESKALREMLNYVPPQPRQFVSARVISDSSTAYVRSVIVNVGDDQNVRKGQAAVDGHGLVGRVTEVGHRSARVLLLTDINSRIPIIIESTRYPAILMGDNSERPKLRFLPVEASPQPGDRIVTSGHGGIFPPGLPVGVIATVATGEVRVLPYVNFDRLEYLRLVDFGADAPLPSVTATTPKPARP